MTMASLCTNRSSIKRRWRRLCTQYFVNRFRRRFEYFCLGYSYDLTWGARSIFSFDPELPRCETSIPQKNNYAYLGAKTAVGEYITPETRQPVTKPIMDCWWWVRTISKPSLGNRFRLVPTRPNQMFQIQLSIVQGNHPSCRLYWTNLLQDALT